MLFVVSFREMRVCLLKILDMLLPCLQKSENTVVVCICVLLYLWPAVLSCDVAFVYIV